MNTFKQTMTTTLTETSSKLVKHYTPEDLLLQLEAAVQQLGKTPTTVTIDDLAPTDEFHVGGREASQHLLDQLALSTEQHILDIGCGLGGAARFTANQYGCRVTGLDLTPAFIDVGSTLNEWVNLHKKVELKHGNAMQVPALDGKFDGAYMLHVGMNIEDKLSVFKEIARVLKPNAQFAIYDLMRIGAGDITFPVPWSGTQATSFVETPETYESALTDAGFIVTIKNNRHEYATTFYCPGILSKVAFEINEPLTESV